MKFHFIFLLLLACRFQRIFKQSSGQKRHKSHEKKGSKNSKINKQPPRHTSTTKHQRNTKRFQMFQRKTGFTSFLRFSRHFSPLKFSFSDFNENLEWNFRRRCTFQTKNKKINFFIYTFSRSRFLSRHTQLFLRTTFNCGRIQS